MPWDAFEAACPELASRASERFSKDELVMLGTLRAGRVAAESARASWTWPGALSSG